MTAMQPLKKLQHRENTIFGGKGNMFVLGEVLEVLFDLHMRDAFQSVCMQAYSTMAAAVRYSSEGQLVKVTMVCCAVGRPQGTSNMVCESINQEVDQS